MKIESTPFTAIAWEKIAPKEQAGERGTATSRTLEFGAIRVRRVSYSPGYLADHWCSKGHVVHLLEGEMVTELQSGAKQRMKAGMTYVVADGADAHRSSTESGATLLIVD